MQFLRGRGGQGVGSDIGNPFDVCNFFVGVKVKALARLLATHSTYAISSWRGGQYYTACIRNKIRVYDVTKGYVLRQLDGDGY